MSRPAWLRIFFRLVIAVAGAAAVVLLAVVPVEAARTIGLGLLLIVAGGYCLHRALIP